MSLEKPINLVIFLIILGIVVVVGNYILHVFSTI